MKERRGVCVVTLLLALAPFPPSGGMAQAADAAEGHRIADRWCSSCHIAGDRGTDAVPTLESIARNRGHDARWLRQWLSEPHPPMPNPNLTRAEIEDVVAYLESLSRQGSAPDNREKSILQAQKCLAACRT